MTQGFATQLSIGGTLLEFLNVKPLTMRELVDNQPQAIRGVLDHQSERTALGRLHIGYQVTANCGAKELELLLPLMGFTASSNNYTIGDTYSTFDAVLNLVEKVHHCTTAKIGKVVFFGQRGTNPIGVTFQILGTAFTEDTSFGSPTALNVKPIYAFHHGVLTLRGGAKNFNQFQLAIDPHMEVQWNNSALPTGIEPTDRDVLLSCSTPYTSAETTLFTTPLSDSSGAAASLVWTNGSNVTTFTFGNLKEIARPPGIPNKLQLRLPLTLRGYKTASSPVLAITNVVG